MIHDAEALAEIRLDWQGVQALIGRLEHEALAGGQRHYPFVLVEAAGNLPFIHAMGVLNDVLKQLAAESRISCSKITLAALVKASTEGSTPLPWQDLTTIWECVDKRTDVAHYGTLASRAECLLCIAAVRRELVAWGIIS